ncbi:MAG: 23S rRNA (guanosine(2251)-2'-O)-methyltransferase RlmB [Clostridia bacterium]|jgi:23S rRNA (guanosine2251-2'-O)-methyltransferase|nr:23S rRNA (guanosine(2251)-2'-O)-methyltransferase RlmB [Clostridiales bacterium]
MDGDGIARGCDTVEGRNPVSELLRTQRKVERILAAKGLDPTGRRIVDRARGMGICVEHVDRRRLDKLSRTGAHQGIIALVEQFRYAEGHEVIIEGARAVGQDPLVVVLDRVSDPHNLGAVIRTAHCCGAHGVIIPKRNAAGVTPAAVKAAAGAAGYMPVAQVTNTARALEQMKDMGLWIAGADVDGEIMYKADLKGPIALVAGSEGKGLSRLVREKCDFLVSVPMKGVLSSLNVSVATGVLLYEVLRQREYQ